MGRSLSLQRTILGSLLAVLACGESRIDPDVPVVVQPARYGTDATLVLEDTVRRDIGGLAARSEDEFDHLNGFLAGRTRSDGGLAVIDAHRVRLFDRDGAPTAVVGRQGRGPGEFLMLTAICRVRDDRVLVFDQQRRVSEIDAAGTLVRQHTLPELTFASDGCFDDGSFLVQQLTRELMTDGGDALAVRYGADGAVRDSIGRFPSPGFQGWSAFARLHAHGAWLYVADPRRSEVKRYRADGTLERILRTEDAPRPMRAEDARYWLGGPVAAAGSGSRADAATREVADVTWPFYRDLRIDASGRLWIRDFPEDDEAPDRYAIYDSTFAFVGRLDLPRGPRRPVRNARPGAPATAPGVAPTFVDAVGDDVVLLIRDADGAAHFVTRRLRPR